VVQVRAGIEAAARAGIASAVRGTAALAESAPGAGPAAANTRAGSADAWAAVLGAVRCAGSARTRAGEREPATNLCSPAICRFVLAPSCPASPENLYCSRAKAIDYWFAFTSCWTCKSSSKLAAESGSESDRKSWSLSSICKSPTAVPGVISPSCVGTAFLLCPT